jgi:hypothetical protein
MIQCDKLLGLGLAESRDVLKKSGLCTFCLKHSAEFECYGKGGLSKPRCTRNGCDVEHTPIVHMLLGEDDAKVNFIAGAEGEDEYETVYEAGDGHGAECEYEWEYEDGGLWVGTVGAVEMLEWGGKASGTTDATASVLSGSHLDEVRDNDQAKREGDFQVNRDPEEGSAGDEWWDLEKECPGLEDAEVSTSRAEPPYRPPYGASRPGHPTAAGKQGARKKQKTTADQQWEEARQNAWLRQMLSSGLSSEDEDEGQHGRWAEPGRWTPELCEPP